MLAARTARAADAEVNIFLSESIGIVDPNLHGHFIEHLGGVIYDGIWVGERSRIPNTGGIRQAVVDAMKNLGPTVMRWPGGCFADSYDWRDGIGPSNSRPRRNNFWAGSERLLKLPDNHPAKNDTNAFGTNEFMRFCRLIQAEPYFAANLRSLPARDFYQWIEYCNSTAEASTLGEKRASFGDKEPYNVKFWGIGNESWGCGGNLTAEEYSVEFRKFISWVPRYGTPLHFIPAGPNGADYQWTRGFFTRLTEKSRGLLNQVWGWALHYYCGRTGKGDSVDFTANDYYELLDRSTRMEELISRHWHIMGEIDREHRVKLVIDEWGAWHHDATAVAPHHLFGSVPTMRDALVAALTLDIFHRHADKVVMANVAQLVNCIQTLFLAHEDRFCLTPTYHVFQMYRDHHKGQAVRSEFAAPGHEYTLDGKPKRVIRLDGSATRSGNRVTVTAANTTHDQPVEATIRIHGATVKEAQAIVLAGAQIQSHNTFADPEQVKPKPADVRVVDGRLVFRFPAASVTKLSVTVA